ncbi:ATP-grasp domain-containing protein [Actinomadura barringtoniae]|uniref:ATP-grasp domain-containing protein n=1 Tax=Actinomadura barringtoniae TaxID=1427535 RepID=A0A939TA93_9ACTN|nr:ATP-grasp domain-containing protein [Actinomadura barringtoniae]MBO2455154.1 ATP-grasp domain-containing protein [Actinomadura barringtoniae]
MLHLVAGKVTDSVTHGFLPAAERLGLQVVLLTDRPADHAKVFGGPIVACDVKDYREIVAAAEKPTAFFSNSDFLQASTALAATYFGLPGKDWRAATRAKNKALMRRHLASRDPVFAADAEAERVPVEAPFPLVLKPREGVASEDVFLVHDANELAARTKEIRTRRADALVVEEYLPGQLYTLETLGDGRETRVLGSYLTTISPPPHFIEERLEWAPPPPETDQIVAQIKALGIGLGACHTEFVVHDGRARIIEVNYRVIGDHCDFLMADLLGIPLFEQILRVHLGERLPAPTAPPGLHAVADVVLAERAGTLTEAPEAMETKDGDVRLAYMPQRATGESFELTHTNRDYLGTIRAIGPAKQQVEAAIGRFRAAHSWTIR